MCEVVYEEYYKEKQAILQEIGKSGKVLMRTEEFKAHVDRWGFNFLRSGVLTVRIRNGNREYLCTEEKMMKVGKDYVEVHDVWNLPSGACKSTTEKRIDAGIREVLDETGYRVEITGFLFTTSKADENFPYAMNVYVAKPLDDDPVQDFNHNEVRSIRWMTAGQIAELDERHQLRSPHFMLNAVRQYEKGLVLSLDYAVDR